MTKVLYKDHTYALILAGGGGTRLWPISRNKTPKQFLKLIGDSTFTQSTLYRMNKMLPWERIFVITSSEEYRDEILKEVSELSSENVFVEPMRRDTAPAHALGALYIHKKDPKAVIINEAVDHIEAPKDYFETVKVAAQAAFEGDWLVAIGIKPTDPHTGYGYIRRGKKLKVIDNKVVYKLDKFTEKPSSGIAKRFLHHGKYYWNANHYVWSAESFLSAVRKHAPEISKSIDEISKSVGKKNESDVLRREYNKMPKMSVDYAISEKANNFLLITTHHKWLDIGDWSEVWENLKKDKDGNAIFRITKKGTGELMSVDTSNSLVHLNNRVIALVGVEDTIIIDTGDALLVCSRDKAQSVKKIVNQIKEDAKTELL